MNLNVPLREMDRAMNGLGYRLAFRSATSSELDGLLSFVQIFYSHCEGRETVSRPSVILSILLPDNLHAIDIVNEQPTRVGFVNIVYRGVRFSMFGFRTFFL